MHNMYKQWILDCNFSVLVWWKSLFHTRNSTEDFKFSWPGITTWYMNTMLSARINLISATTIGFSFQRNQFLNRIYGSTLDVLYLSCMVLWLNQDWVRTVFLSQYYSLTVLEQQISVPCCISITSTLINLFSWAMWILPFHSAYSLLYKITSQRQLVVFTNSVCVKTQNLYTWWER